MGRSSSRVVAGALVGAMAALVPPGADRTGFERMAHGVRVPRKAFRRGGRDGEIWRFKVLTSGD